VNFWIVKIIWPILRKNCTFPEKPVAFCIKSRLLFGIAGGIFLIVR
jgi:hypothetical protein